MFKRKTKNIPTISMKTYIYYGIIYLIEKNIIFLNIEYNKQSSSLFEINYMR